MVQSIKGKLVLFAGVLIVLTMLVTSLVIYFQLSDGIAQSVDENASATVEDVERFIQEYMDKYSMATDLLAEDERTAAFLEEEDPAEWAGVAATHETFMTREEGAQLIYVGTQEGEMLTTPVIDLPEDFDPRTRPWYEDALASEGEVIWTDPYIDIDTEELIITVAKTVTGNTGVLGVQAMDLSLNNMVLALEESEIGYNGELALLDSTGTYIAHTDVSLLGETVDENSYLQGAAGAEGSGSLEGNGQTAYYQEVDNFGWTVLSHYNDSDLYQELSSTRNTFIIVGLLAVLLALAAAYIAAGKLAKPIREVNEHVSRMADGDLTHNLSIKGKDEIGQLGSSVNHMTAELRALIGSIQTSANNSRAMSEELSAISEETVATSDDMSLAVNGVAEGAAKQAEDIDEMNRQMQQLADQLEQANNQTKEMNTLSDSIRDANMKGSEQVQTLEDRTEASSEVFREVNQAVTALTEKVGDIGIVVKTISEFADQTNLLALNASIEAARAGEHGKGFAVVADEVRKLAEQSLAATTKINSTLAEVETETEQVAASITSANSMQEEQQQAVQDTRESLGSIITSIESLRGVISALTSDLETVNSYKDNITASIANVAEVAENAAATAEEVSASASEQTKAVEQVGSNSEQLNDLSADLQTKTSRFHV
ncbi:methyl-accepting chemotaxis protein [Alkalicoccus daliensis]|uniref:Methyl-accepting chemotaxis protein n=1 Tax=Alkalicoccus daliensis TaxID=745820 RepID=A0A1H0K4W0_9BACI|nr:methyl-accepting chemotaxis protein [Alkalicoccus daliensis]SDO50790.1 methyl-accepting chemotaxis protein [Alkalicoccus daliensis]